MNVPEGPFAQFHMIIRGECVLHTNGISHPLYNGDIVMFPKGNAHWIANSQKSKRVNGKEIVKAFQNGKSYFKGDKVSATLVCGHFELNKELSHPLIDSLPEIIKLTDLST